MLKDIIIIGAGPSGLLTSLALSYYEIRSTILEKSSLDNIHFNNDIRNYALTNHSQKFLEKINLWEIIKKYSVEVKDIYVVDNKSSHILELNANKMANKSLGYMIPASEFKSILLSLVQKNKLINIIDNIHYNDVQIKNDKAEIILEDNTIQNARLFLGCDGKSSLLHKKYFGHDIKKDYKQTGLVFNIKHTNKHNNSALEHFIPNGVFAALPLKSEYESSIVWSDSHEIAEYILKLNPQEAAQYLYNKIGTSYGEVEIISPIISYPIKAKITDRYFYKNIALIGDAAHSIHPLAGQGFNQSIKDIESITNIIKKRIALGLELDEYMLEEYEKSRKFDNLKMFHITNSLNQLFTCPNPFISSIRKIGFSILNYNIIKKYI